VLRDENAIAEGLEDTLQHLTQRLAILHQQDHRAAVIPRFRGHCRRPGNPLLAVRLGWRETPWRHRGRPLFRGSGHREIDPEHRAPPELRLYLDVPGRLLNDAVHRRETESGALATTLGRE